jgi:chromosome segregation ATPase
MVSSQEPQPETPGDDALRASFNQQWLAQEARLQTYKTRVSELERAAEEAKKKHDSAMADLRASFDTQWIAFKAEMDSKIQSYKTQVSQLESAAKEARRTSAQSKVRLPCLDLDSTDLVVLTDPEALQ